jgi:hypothetical protein
MAPRRQRHKIRNSNIEIRNKPEQLNPNYEIRNGLVWNFLIFDDLKLFRISGFELRICSFVYTWRALRLCASHLFPIPQFKKTANLKYVWLWLCALGSWQAQPQLPGQTIFN